MYPYSCLYFQMEYKVDDLLEHRIGVLLSEKTTWLCFSIKYIIVPSVQHSLVWNWLKQAGFKYFSGIQV